MATTVPKQGAPLPAGVFQGYDSVTGRGLSTAVTGKTETVGGTSSVTYHVCTDLETLSNALEIDQSLSVGFGSTGSFDEKMHFVHSLKVTSYSVSIVVFSRHTLGKDTTTSVELKTGIKPHEGHAGLVNFFRAYGDSYVVSTTRGGEYYAVYTFYSQTREEQSQLTASMKANGIFEGGSIDGSMQAKITSFSSSTNIQSSFDQNISGLLNPKLPSSDQIISFALTFPSITLDAPAIIGFETSGYEHVPGFGSFQPIAKNRNFFVGDGVIDGLTKPLIAIEQLQNQIALIESIYSFYGGYSDSKLVSVGAQAKTDYATIIQLIEKYESDPTQAFTQPNLPSIANGTPSLAYVVSQTQKYGGDGGNSFNDVDVNTFLQRQTRISAVTLSYADLIDKLIATYTDRDHTWSIEHGGNGGKIQSTLSLLPGQFINRITGAWGNRVDHLTISSTSGGSVDGGGKGGEGPIDWSVPAGSFMLGFAGGCYAELDRIIFVYGTFQPATWG